MRTRIDGYLMITAIGILGAKRARADDKMICVRAADAAQEQRTEGKLRDARASLHTCARDVCPALVRSDCTQWLSEVEASMPTVVIRAQNARGDDLADVQIDLDGRRIVDRLEGLPIDVDPGPHVLGWRRGNQSGRQEIVVHTGEKNRPVTLGIDSEAARGHARSDAPRTEERRPSPAAWILAGVAVAGGASFAYFGLRGSSEVRDMRSECAGHCPASRVDAARDKLLAADISLGISLVSAGLATYFFVSPATPPKSAPSREVGVAPVTGGIAAVWLERF